MGEVERIELRKIYPGRAALFGLLYGLFIGVILALLVFLILNFVGDFGLGLIGNNTGITDYLALSGAILFATPLLMALLTLIAALIYNVVCKMGGFLYLGLSEPEPVDNKAQKKEDKKEEKK